MLCVYLECNINIVIARGSILVKNFTVFLFCFLLQRHVSVPISNQYIFFNYTDDGFLVQILINVSSVQMLNSHHINEILF